MRIQPWIFSHPMTAAEKHFHQISIGLANARESKMFGALCIKATNGKSAAIFWKNEMIFKLNEQDMKEALQLKGSRPGTHLYDSNRPMKGWVAVPFSHASHWKDFAMRSITFVMKTK